jgi:hypothetical protein
MDKNIEFIDSFYKNPKNINKGDVSYIQRILEKFKKDKVENKYLLFVADNDNIKKLFILFIYYYDYLIKNDEKKKHHCGIDFEFNVKQIALMQINFGRYIWVIDPKKYDEFYIRIITKKLFLNNKVYKVLHGADSLDLPYIFNDILKNDKTKILRFMKKFIDTRFLCEYVRYSKEEEGKCSIYDAMLYFNTISKDKYDKLQKINDSMGPVQDVMWNIEKLSSFHIKYAFYDVLNLLDFLFDIYRKVIKETPKLIKTYYYIIQIIRFVILERKGVTAVIEMCKNTINPLNNYLIKSSKGNITLINAYNDLMSQLVLVENNNESNSINLNFIESVNYVKGVFNYLLKYIFYYICITKYKVYKNKTELMTDKINIKNLYNELEKIKMYKIIKLLNRYEKEVSNKINL